MKLLAPLFLLFFSSGLVAQKKTNWGFMPGIIHLKKGDSIVGLVEKQVVYDQTLLYKLNEQANTEEIPVSQVNYFTANNKTFGSVPLYNSYIIMELLDTGKFSLYTFNEIKYGETEKNKSTGVKTQKGDIIIHYVLTQPATVQEIKEATFKTLLKQLFSDCQRMAGKVTRGDYLFEDMPQIVKDYNSCKGAYCDHSTQHVKPD
jgi:hypothetical protein